ncbi:MAG: hypothetical protein ACRDKX_09340 [Solirubrobacterales bacterium]
MSQVPVIQEDGNGVLGDHAVVSGSAAAVLVRLLGDWRWDFVRLGFPATTLAEVEQAVDALRAAACAGLARGESGQGQRKPEVERSGRWLTTNEVAAAIGRTPQRVRQLRAEDRVDGQLVAGRMRYPPETIAQALAQLPGTEDAHDPDAR